MSQKYMTESIESRQSQDGKGFPVVNVYQIQTPGQIWYDVYAGQPLPGNTFGD